MPNRQPTGETVPPLEARELVCVMCRQAFIWSAAEQAFYAEHVLAVPRRCPRCRAVRRHLRAEGKL